LCFIAPVRQSSIWYFFIWRCKHSLLVASWGFVIVATYDDYIGNNNTSLGFVTFFVMPCVNWLFDYQRLIVATLKFNNNVFCLLHPFVEFLLDISSFVNAKHSLLDVQWRLVVTISFDYIRHNNTPFGFINFCYVKY